MKDIPRYFTISVPSSSPSSEKSRIEIIYYAHKLTQLIATRVFLWNVKFARKTLHDFSLGWLRVAQIPLLHRNAECTEWYSRHQLVLGKSLSLFADRFCCTNWRNQTICCYGYTPTWEVETEDLNSLPATKEGGKRVSDIPTTSHNETNELARS